MQFSSEKSLKLSWLEPGLFFFIYIYTVAINAWLKVKNNFTVHYMG